MSLDISQLISSVLSEKNGKAMHVTDILDQIQRQTAASKSELTNMEEMLFKESSSPYSRVERVEGKLGWFRAKAGCEIKQERLEEGKESKYRMKYKKMRQIVKNLVYVNYSYAEELQRTKQLIVQRKAERQYLLKKLRGYESGHVPLTQIGKKRSSRATGGNRAAQARHTRQKKQKDKARAKARSAFAAANAAVLERLHKEQANVVKGAPTKRKRLKPGMIKKKLQPIPLDPEGHPVMPINLGGLTVTSLGQIVSDRSGFHSERYIWPVGFESQRTFFSMHTPGTKCVYVCRIIDRGEAPLFEITATDDLDNPIQAGSATACHSTVLKRVNKTRSRDATNTGSGPEFFGFSHPVVVNILQNHPEARLLTKFQRVEFDDPLGVQNTLIKMPEQEREQAYSTAHIPSEAHGGDVLPLIADGIETERLEDLNVSRSVGSSSSDSSTGESESSSESEGSSISGSEESELSESEGESNDGGSTSASSSDSNPVMGRDGIEG